MKLQHEGIRAFSLLELSVVLAIIGAVLAGGFVIGLGALDAERYNATTERMDNLHKALLDYSVTFNRLPCPASLALAEGNANFGVEGATPGTCTGGIPAADFTSSSGAVEGGVPTRALQLPDEYQFDGWGRRLRYAVNPEWTAAGSLPHRTGSCKSAKAITVKDSAASNRTTEAAYVLVSHGANGHAGYTRNGVAFNAGSTNSDEQTNCHCNASAVSTAYAATYVAKLPTENSSSVTDNFDDIVTFRDAWQLQTPTMALGAGSCPHLYVLDKQNCRIQKFTLDGTYVSQIGRYNSDTPCTSGPCDCGNLNGQIGNGAHGSIAADADGNLYQADSDNNRVQKFSSNGTYLYSLSGGQTQYYSRRGIAFDAAGDVWVTNGNDCPEYGSGFGPCAARMQEFSSATGVATGNLWGDSDWVPLWSPVALAFDSGGNAWIATGSGGTVRKFNSGGTLLNEYSSAAGGTGGTFTSIPDVKVGANGNIYVADYSNSRVVVLDSAFNYVGSASSGQNISAIALDSSGNLWTSDANRIVQYDAALAFVKQIGCVSGACSAGSGDGQFNDPGYIAISPK